MRPNACQCLSLSPYYRNLILDFFFYSLLFFVQFLSAAQPVTSQITIEGTSIPSLVSVEALSIPRW